MLMCRDLAGMASDYVDGELSITSLLSIRMHLLMCRHCRAFLSRFRASSSLIQGHLEPQIDHAFIVRLDAEVTRVLGTREAGQPLD